MSGNSYYILSFFEGILTFISPCILPMLPVYFMYLVGETAADCRTFPNSRLVLNSLGFVAGFTLVFVLLGATSTAIGHYLKGNQAIFRMASGSLMVLFGLNFLGILRIPFINMDKHFNFKSKQPAFFSSILFGLVFAFGWTPCLGTFLSSALIMAGNSDTLQQGVLMLLLYSAGLGIPFIATSLLLEKVHSVFGYIKKQNRIISLVSGIVLILAGILVFTDRMKYLNTFFS